MKPVGKITHYYGRVKVAVVDLHGELKVGDSVRIEKEGDGFDQVVSSMQIEKEDVEKGGKGDKVSIKVIQVPKKGSLVIVEE